MRRLLIMLTLGVILALPGCAGFKPLDKDAAGISTPDELPPGPGLFTGKDGEWTIGTEI